MKRWMSRISVAVTVASVTVFAQAPPREQAPPGVAMESSTSRPVSATVVATTMVRTTDGVSALNLMVLWRGSNGWFLKAGARGSGGGGTQQTLTARATFAGVALLAELDLQPRAVRIQGKPVILKPADANVILVDGVESPDLRVVSTLKIDPAIVSDRQIEPLFKRAPEVLAFLQCDQKSAIASVQMLEDRSCQGPVYFFFAGRFTSGTTMPMLPVTTGVCEVVPVPTGTTKPAASLRNVSITAASPPANHCCGASPCDCSRTCPPTARNSYPIGTWMSRTNFP